jgi:scyllo-inositol 2-dehydrogenase (NADP+)
MPVRVGIVGLGTWGTWHANQIRNRPGFALRAVCDITPAQRQMAERELGCTAYADLRDFLADEQIDLVIVATPSHAHEKPVVAALKAGKHVLCEKPLGRTEAEARRMFAAANRAHRTLMAFQNRRGDADFLTVKKTVASGKLGRLNDIRMIRWGWTNVMETFGTKSYRPGWRTEAAYGGGTLLDFGPHHVDQLLQILPDPIVSVFGDLRGRRWTADADDQFLAILRTKGGLVAQIEYSQNAHVPVHVAWAIAGERGGFRFDGEQSALYTRTKNGKERVRPVKNAKEDWNTLYENMRAVIAGKAEPAVPPRETLRLMRVLDAIRRSARTGRVVALRDEYAPHTGRDSK